MQVFRRGTLARVIGGMGYPGAPQSKVKEVKERIRKWLLPIYDYQEAEELCIVPADQLQSE